VLTILGAKTSYSLTSFGGIYILSSMSNERGKRQIVEIFVIYSAIPRLAEVGGRPSPVMNRKPP
jgi:hypothetical protein